MRARGAGGVRLSAVGIYITLLWKIRICLSILWIFGFGLTSKIDYP